MQATLERNIKGIDMKSESVSELLSSVESVDAKKRNEIENTIVEMGSRVVPELVDMLQVIKGTTRGIVAMVLIRIGQESVDYLQNKAKADSDFEWIAQYLTAEIIGNAQAA